MIRLDPRINPLSGRPEQSLLGRLGMTEQTVKPVLASDVLQEPAAAAASGTSGQKRAHNRARSSHGFQVCLF